MKRFITSYKFFLIIFAVLFLFAFQPRSAEAKNKTCPELKSFFTKSLHFTGKGMKYWYQKPDGFMSITKIPYENLGCKSCHVDSCDTCHKEKKQGKLVFSQEKARDISTCFQCHSREKFTFMIDKKQENLDVHRQANMTCVDCHNEYEIHGDGTAYLSMRDPKHERAKCQDCHNENNSSKAASYNKSLLSHQIHGNKLDCAACHVSNSLTCYNCHFDSYLDSGKKKENFIPMKSWTLLINYDGKVTSGTVQTIVYKDQKFIAYVPYFSHSVTSSGRSCQDCHGNKAVTTMNKEGTFEVVGYENGKVTSHEGIIPLVPNKLKWTFFNKSEQGWQPIKKDTQLQTQFAGYGKPLTQQQYQMLLQPMK